MSIEFNIESPSVRGDGNLENIIIKYENALKFVKENNTIRVVEIVIKQLKKFAQMRKWKTIPDAIRSQRISNDEFIVYPSGEKSQLVGWLHYGTKRHFIAPKSAKALHWVQGGKDRFSKGHYVSGIIGTHFFQVTPDMQSEIRQYLTRVLKVLTGMNQ